MTASTTAQCLLSSNMQQPSKWQKSVLSQWVSGKSVIAWNFWDLLLSTCTKHLTDLTADVAPPWLIWLSTSLDISPLRRPGDVPSVGSKEFLRQWCNSSSRWAWAVGCRWMPLDAVGCPGDALGYLWPLGHSLYSLAAHGHTTVQNMATMGNYMPVVTATNSYQSNPTKNNQMNRPPEYHSFNVSVNFQFSNLSEQKVL